MGHGRHKSRRSGGGPAPQRDAASDAAAHGSPVVLAGLLIAVVGITLVIHWPVLSCTAISFDDKQYLTENYLVQNPSWASAGRFLGEVLEPSTVGGYYQPLAMVSLMLDCAVGGGPDNLRPFHRTSLALHAANTALVVLLLYALFRQPWAAAMAGLLFGAHPMTVEPTAWIGERKTVLATFFALWSLLAYVRYVRARGRGWYVLALVAFIFALLSKPTSTPLPLLLVLLDFWPLRRLSRRAVLEKIPFFAVGAASAVITYISQSLAGGVAAPGEYPLARILLTLCHNIIFYLYKIAWPVNLSPHYPYPVPFALSSPMVLTGVIGTCVLVPLLLISLRRTRAALTGWLFFFTAIFPTMGVIGFTTVIASDKYAYLPMVGLLMALACLLGWLLGGSLRGGAGTRAWVPLAVVAVLCVLEAGATRTTLRHWRDSETLARYMLSLTPDVAILHHYLGTVLADQERLEEAVAQHAEAIRLSPGFADAHDSMGRVLVRLGRIEEAVARYEEAIRLRPEFAEAYDNLGVALGRLGRLDEAAARGTEALRLKPAFPVAHSNLAVTLMKQNRLDEAVAHYREALRLSPAFHEAHNNLGNALLKLGRLEEALAEYAAALRLRPDFPEAHNNLANALIRQGRRDEAIARYIEALRLRPAFPEAHASLAAALAKQGRLDEAAQHYRSAIRLQPGSAASHKGLGAVLARLGRTDEAMREYREALRLNPQDSEVRSALEGTATQRSASGPG